MEFGPFHTVGFSVIAAVGTDAFSRIWSEIFMPRSHEIASMEGAACFGICIAIPEQVPMTIKYIAAIECSEEAGVPPGAEAYKIPFGHYCRTDVSSLSEISEGWQRAMANSHSVKGWVPDPNRSPFEFYPPDFTHNGPLQIYAPLIPA